MCQPPPSRPQVVPASVDNSKLTCCVSGELPPRSHSMRLTLVMLRDWVADSLISRAIRLRGTPPTDVKSPPMMMAPSA